MASMSYGLPYNAVRELTTLHDPWSALRDAKKHVLGALRESRTWSDLIGNELVITLDQRPASLLRRVDFDISEDTRGDLMVYREADIDDPLSW